MYDPKVHIHKSVLMQRLLDAASRGYPWHTSGTVPVQKAPRLANKFAELYGVSKNQNQRAYAKRMRRANARLYFYAPDRGDKLHWWLLATGGAGAVNEHERLQDATSAHGRIRVGTDYELLRRTRPSAKGGGTVWSWRMTRACYGQWRERIISACRHSEPWVVTQTLGSLYRTPGFSGIRQQVGKLSALARSEWRRRHGNLDALVFPPRLNYIERLPDTAVGLWEWCRPYA